MNSQTLTTKLFQEFFQEPRTDKNQAEQTDDYFLRVWERWEQFYTAALQIEEKPE
jgi:hypothetical protein